MTVFFKSQIIFFQITDNIVKEVIKNYLFCNSSLFQKVDERL